MLRCSGYSAIISPTILAQLTGSTVCNAYRLALKGIFNLPSIKEIN
jgi:hypothetical protein